MPAWSLLMSTHGAERKASPPGSKHSLSTRSSLAAQKRNALNPWESVWEGFSVAAKAFLCNLESIPRNAFALLTCLDLAF